MERLSQAIVSNIQTICKLKDYPTHQLRVLHSQSCFPELQHETRHMPSISRPFSGDSRHVVLDVVATTIVFLQQHFPLCEEKLRHIHEMMNAFLDGLHVLKVKYEHDVSVNTRIDALTNDLKGFFTSEKNTTKIHLV